MLSALCQWLFNDLIHTYSSFSYWALASQWAVWIFDRGKNRDSVGSNTNWVTKLAYLAFILSLLNLVLNQSAQEKEASVLEDRCNYRNYYNLRKWGCSLQWVTFLHSTEVLDSSVLAVIVTFHFVALTYGFSTSETSDQCAPLSSLEPSV